MDVVCWEGGILLGTMWSQLRLSRAETTDVEPDSSGHTGPVCIVAPPPVSHVSFRNQLCLSKPPFSVPVKWGVGGIYLLGLPEGVKGSIDAQCLGCSSCPVPGGLVIAVVIFRLHRRRSGPWCFCSWELTREEA